MTSLQPVRGTRDLLPGEFSRHKMLYEIANKVALMYGFQEIDTPIFEFADVFKRTLGDASDIVTKEMYTFLDKNGDSVTLRPEYTAGIVRMIISNGLCRKLPVKLFGFGPMFRYERPQKGRQRQFHQVNLETLGVDDPMADVELMALGHHFLTELGVIELVKLQVNTLGDVQSRRNYRKKLIEYFTAHKSDLSEESVLRLSKNPLRILDSKSKLDQVLIESAPMFEHSLNNESKDFFAMVREGLSELNIPFEINQRLVRGMDYYCHSAFEFVTSSLGAQGAVLAGGRYDGLSEMMGGPKVPGVGWAGGVERLVMLSNVKPEVVAPIAIIPIGENPKKMAYKLTNDLRRKSFVVDFSFSGNLKKRLSRANNLKAKVALLIGDDELANESVTMRDMETGEQKEVPLNGLEESLARFN